MIVFKKDRWKNIRSTGKQFTEKKIIRKTRTLNIDEKSTDKLKKHDELGLGWLGKL